MSNVQEQPAAVPIAFAGGPLDRVDQVRIDADKLAEAWADPRARIVLLDGLDPVLQDGGVLATAPVPSGAALVGHALLGVRPDGAPLFVSLVLSEPSEPPSFPPKVWQVAAELQPEELAIYGGARSIADWHQRHGFCAKCGQPTAPVKAGWARQCDACQTEHFPRTDPVVIMLAEYEGKVLIGRNSRFPPRRFSALAGFVEPGETIEEAVRRELWEEAGIRVGRVDYMMSQPWPFPSQLMIACTAQAESDVLTLDEAEIVEALWVSRADVAKAFAEDEDALFLAPASIAVAHHMLKAWFESRAVMQWIAPLVILIAAIWIVPMSVRSMKHARKGRLGSAMVGIATALDPARRLIVEEVEKRQNQDGEEVGGEDEPLPEERR